VVGDGIRTGCIVVIMVVVGDNPVEAAFMRFLVAMDMMILAERNPEDEEGQSPPLANAPIPNIEMVPPSQHCSYRFPRRQ
jgi:hypothetical protein